MIAVCFTCREIRAFDIKVRLAIEGDPDAPTVADAACITCGTIRERACVPQDTIGVVHR